MSFVTSDPAEILSLEEKYEKVVVAKIAGNAKRSATMTGVPQKSVAQIAGYAKQSAARTRVSRSKHSNTQIAISRYTSDEAKAQFDKMVSKIEHLNVWPEKNCNDGDL